MTYYVMWFYISNFDADNTGKPKPRAVKAAGVRDAIDRGVFYRAEEFRQRAWFVVWSDANPKPWVGQYGDAV